MVFEHSDMPPPPLPNDKPKKKWRQDKKQRKKVYFLKIFLKFWRQKLVSSVVDLFVIVMTILTAVASIVYTVSVGLVSKVLAIVKTKLGIV